MADEKDEPIKEFSEFTEHAWFTAALSLGAITVACAPFAIGWVAEYGGDLDKMRSVTAIITPFATAFGAAITFCTVVWRGKVASRQADQQRRQNDAKDIENLARLLFDGASKLHDANRKTDVRAGIAALHAVVVSGEPSYAVCGMDVLSYFIEENVDNETVDAWRAAVDAFNAGADKGHYCTRDLTLRRDSILKWVPINGAPFIVFSGGTMSEEVYREIRDRPFKRFESMQVADCSFQSLEAEPTFQKCVFLRCRFREVDDQIVKQNIFMDCDFSDANFAFDIAVHHDIVAGLKNSGNHFREGLPPRSALQTDWNEILAVKS